MKHRGAKIHARQEDLIIAPLTAISNGFVGSTYSAGFNTHAAAGDTATTFSAPGVDLGIKVFRDDAIWSDVEQTSGNLTWTHARLVALETAIDNMNAAGIRPLCIIGVHSASDGKTPPFSHRAGYADPAITPTEYQAYVTFVVSHLGSKCNDYDVYNEYANSPQTLTDLEYRYLLENTYQKIKDANPSATVWGNVLDPNATSHEQALVANGGFNFMDGWLPHSYYGITSSQNHTAEYVAKKTRNSIGVVHGSYSGLRFGIGECGWGTDTVSQDLAGRNLAREAFMFRAMAPIEIHCVYACYDYNNGLGLNTGVSGGPNRKLAANYFANAIAITQDATSAAYYQDLPVHQVALLRSNGNRNLAIWGNTSAGVVGDTAANSDASGNKSVWVKNLGGTGTLICTSMEDGSTTSQTLNLGTQQYTIAYSPIAVVLSSTQIIQFPQCPV